MLVSRGRARYSDPPDPCRDIYAGRDLPGGDMEIGKIERIREIVPREEPVPPKAPVKQPEPVRVPEREKVPA